eukprot:UN02872
MDKLPKKKSSRKKKEEPKMIVDKSDDFFDFLGIGIEDDEKEHKSKRKSKEIQIQESAVTDSEEEPLDLDVAKKSNPISEKKIDSEIDDIIPDLKPDEQKKEIDINDLNISSEDFVEMYIKEEQERRLSQNNDENIKKSSVKRKREEKSLDELSSDDSDEYVELPKKKKRRLNEQLEFGSGSESDGGENDVNLEKEEEEIIIQEEEIDPEIIRSNNSRVKVLVVQLKDILRNNGCTVTGRKAVLIDRCTDNGIDIAKALGKKISPLKNSTKRKRGIGDYMRPKKKKKVVEYETREQIFENICVYFALKKSTRTGVLI